MKEKETSKLYNSITNVNNQFGTVNNLAQIPAGDRQPSA